MKELFHRLAENAAHAVGSYWAFLIALLTIVVWALTGPYFNYSDTWQLFINTGTTIVTFLMVFLIQNTQNRETRIVALKLDELLRGVEGARTGLVELDHMSDDDLELVRLEFARMSRATSTTFTCAATKTGKVIGSSFIGCTISGRPCARTSPLAGAIVEDEDDNEVKRPRGKRDRVDDDDRDRGSRNYERRRYRAPQRRTQWSRAHRREMAYQDYLAGARRRAESRAYRREMAYQDYLAAARSRAEAAAWRREEARQRYLANQRRWAERRRMWAY